MTILEIAAFVIAMLGWTMHRAQKMNQPLLFCCLMGISLVAGCLYIAHIPLPSSTTPIRTMFEPLGRWMVQQ